MPGSWGKRNETKRAFFNLIDSLIKSESHPKQHHWQVRIPLSFLNRNVIPFSSNCLLLHFLYPSLGNGKFFQSGCRFGRPDPTQLAALVSGKEGSVSCQVQCLLTWNESRQGILYSLKSWK